MKNIFLTILCLMLLVAFSGCSDSDDDDTTVSGEEQPINVSNEEKAAAVLESLESGDVSVIGEYISADTYIQHNLGFPDGRQAVLDAINAGMLAGTTVDVVRSFTDGDYVVLHSDYFLFGARQVGFDVFRFENGLIVEHWDNLQDYAGPNPSGRTMLDGPTEETDSDKTADNKALVQSFLNDAMIGGNFMAMMSFFDGDAYIQHNPYIGDGLSSLMGGGGGDMSYLKVHYVLGSGDFVLAMSEGRMNGTPAAFYDLFRVENGFIAEHWDVIQEIPPESERANTNGKFGNDVGVLNDEKATNFIENGFGGGDVELLERLLAGDFANSNTGLLRAGGFEGETDKDVLIDFATKTGGAGAVTVLETAEDSETGYVVLVAEFPAREPETEPTISTAVAGFNESGLISSYTGLGDWDGVSSAQQILDLYLNKEKATAVLEALESGDTSAIEKYVSADTYIQHNLGFPDGRQVILDAVAGGMMTGTTVEIQRVFADGDYVILHTKYGGPAFGDSAAFDVFRFENGLIVEHWDNLADIVEDGDGTTQFDGPADVTDTDKTAENKVLVADFAQNVLVDGRWSSYTTYIDEGVYTQHSPGRASGTALFTMFPDGTPFYKSLGFVHGEGNFVLTMSEGYPDQDTGLASAYYDLFRVENGKIVEHWDVVRKIPHESEWANSNGKFGSGGTYGMIQRSEQPPAPTSVEADPGDSEMSGINQVVSTIEPVTNGSTNMLKKATVQSVGGNEDSSWIFMCDEGGRTDYVQQAPNPLIYFTGGASLNLLTHLAETIETLNLDIENIKVEQRIFFRSAYGQGRCDLVETNIVIESDEPLEKLLELQSTAIDACASMEGLINETLVNTNLYVNGNHFDTLRSGPGAVLSDSASIDGLEVTRLLPELPAFETMTPNRDQMDFENMAYDMMAVAEQVPTEESPYLCKASVKCSLDGYAPFVLYSDVGPSAPHPLEYFPTGIGFCLSTMLTNQIQQTADANMEDYRIEQKIKYAEDDASATNAAGPSNIESLEMSVLLKSDASSEILEGIYDRAVAACSSGKALKVATPVDIGLYVNGGKVE